MFSLFKRNMPAPDASSFTTLRKYSAIASSATSGTLKGIPTGGYVAGGFSGGRLLQNFIPSLKKEKIEHYLQKNIFVNLQYTGTNHPSYLTRDTFNNIYLSFILNDIHKYSPSGSLISSVAFLTSDSGSRFSFVIEPITGNYYLPNWRDGTLTVRNPSGVIQAEFPLERGLSYYVAIGTNGKLYVTDTVYSQINISDISTTINTPIDVGQLFPAFIVLDSDNTIYFSSTTEIYKLSTTNIPILIYDTLFAIGGLCIDNNRNLFVLDTTNSRIIKNNIQIIASNLQSPAGLTIDSNSNLYTTEVDIHNDHYIIITKFTY